MWLTLLPPGKPGNNATRKTIANAIDDLIVFCPENGKLPENSGITIAAQGSSKGSICKLYVLADEQLIVTNNTFEDALDILCKLHLIFDYEYVPSLHNFLSYVETYIYGTGSSSNATRHKVYMQLN